MAVRNMTKKRSLQEDDKMARAKYQVLVIPYYIDNGNAEYCIFRRSDMNIWQFIAGGGEDFDESVLLSAKREANEEANIDFNNEYIRLDTVSSIPASCFRDAREIWGDDCYVVPEYCFGVRVDGKEILLSEEHAEYRWCSYEDAVKHLKYDSNRTALWELDCRIKKRFF